MDKLDAGRLIAALGEIAKALWAIEKAVKESRYDTHDGALRVAVTN